MGPAREGPGVTGKLNDKVTEMPMVPTPALLFSLSQSAPMTMGEFLMISLWRRRRVRPGLQIVLYGMQTSPKSGPVQRYSSVLGNPCGTVVKGNPPSEKSFKVCTWVFILLGKRNGHRNDSVLKHVLWPWIHYKKSGEEDRTLWISQNINILYPCECLPKDGLSRRLF